MAGVNQKAVVWIGWWCLLVSFGVAARPAAVAMPDVYSAQTAKAVLQQGGNAVDAAVAAGFVLAVTYPEAGNLGGGGFMTLYTRPGEKSAVRTAALSKQDAQPPQAYFLDYRETAPQAAHRDLYLDEEGDVIPYRSLVGYQASGVPGTVMGLWEAHRRFGSLPWPALLQPAIDYAEKGFEVSGQLAQTAQWYQRWVADKSSDPLNFQDYFGQLRAGKRLVQPELARTLKRLAAHGPEDFYQGETARLLVKQMQAQGGLITLDDLKRYAVRWREPVRGQWQGRTIVSAPPPSSGGVAIVQLLKMHAQLAPRLTQVLAQKPEAGMSAQTRDAVVKSHLYAELSKRVYADRAHFLGDPDFVEVPVAALLEDAYLKTRSAPIRLDAISATEQIRHGPIESPETTHFSILDAQGNAVSNTYTLNMPFGSGVVIEGAGFLMNNEMDDFSTKPGVANLFGVIGGKANEIAAGKRMLSSMSPTIVLKDHEVELVVGTPGGSTIITSVFQTIVNVIEEGMPAQQAVDAPRVHHQLFPENQIAYNPTLPEPVQQALQNMGYRLKHNPYMGDVQLIVHSEQGLSAASDRRGRGVSEVFEVVRDESAAR